MFWISVFKLHHTTFFNNNWYTMISKKEKKRLYKCEHCTFAYFYKITLVWFFAFFFYGVGGFQKSYVIFGGGMSKYLLFLTGMGGWSGKGQKHPYVIYKWPIMEPEINSNEISKRLFGFSFDLIFLSQNYPLLPKIQKDG